MKTILIYTTNDTFFLKDLVLSLSKFSKYKFKYKFGFQINNIKSFLMMFFTLGIINSIKFCFLHFVNHLKKNTLKQKLNYKNFVISNNEANLIKIIKKNKIDLILSINYPKKINYKILNATKYGGGY